jgi:preprotein translocase subunit SecG
MILFFINSIVILKKIWLCVSLLLIFLVLIKKADDENLSNIRLPFFDGSKKSEKILDKFIWLNIFIYILIGIIFSTK